MSIGKEKLKKHRSSVKSVSAMGTRPCHTAIEIIRLEAARLIMKGVPPHKAHAIVARQHAKRDPEKGLFGK